MFTKALSLALFALFAVAHSAQTDVSLQEKSSARTLIHWSRTDSTNGIIQISFRTAIGGSGNTATLSSTMEIDAMHTLLTPLPIQCVLTRQQWCDIIDLIRRRAQGNVPAHLANTMANLSTWADAIAAAKNQLRTAVAQQRYSTIQQRANVSGASAVAKQLYGDAFGDDCTWNYRRCRDEAHKGIRHQRHHCYWATRRCLEDINATLDKHGLACAALFFHSQNILIRVGM